MGYVKKKHKLGCMIMVVGCIIIYFYILWKVSPDMNNAGKLHRKSKYAYSNINYIEYILNSNICLFKKPEIIILITSHVKNEAARNILRKSYPRDLFRQYNAQIIFMLAEQGKLTQISVHKEFQQFNDIVQGNFTEAYRNLTYKHCMGLKWTKEYCSSVKYIVKMDDDIVVNYYTLFQLITRFKHVSHIMGHVIKDMKAIRNISNKWYVSEEEYAKEIYPSFLSGWMYIITSHAVELLLKQIEHAKFFWIDDVFVTGILRELAGVKYKDISQYFRYEPQNVECCIKNKYSCDFVAAPSGKNYLLNQQLHNHLWECRYKKICAMESSNTISCLSQNHFIPVRGYLQTLKKI